MKKIFCFINSGSPGWYSVVALSEDGECVAEHVSSTEGWARHDIGIGSDWKHEKYKVKYPEGYELVWLNKEECKTNAEFLKACELNRIEGEKANAEAK